VIDRAFGDLRNRVSGIIRDLVWFNNGLLVGGPLLAFPPRIFLLGLGDRFLVNHHSTPLAGIAGFAERFQKSQAQFLSRHLHETQTGYFGNLVLGAIATEALHQTLHDKIPVRFQHHVDEVDDDNATDIAQPKLANNFFGRLNVVLGDGFFQVSPGAHKLPRIHIDHGHRFGAINHQ
jgi:hypothetical protein